jgi:hypothetical protein
VSIAVHDNRVYVLNARGGGSIQGYLHIGGVLVRSAQWHRSLGLDPNQTPEFTSTPGQIAFAPDGERQMVTTKNGGNSIDVFRVGSGVPSAPTITSLPGSVPFGVSFDGSGHLAVAEAGPNAVATFTLNRDDTLTQMASLATGQGGTCWIVSVDDKLHLSNAGSGTVSGMAMANSGALTALGVTPTGAGTIDAALSSDGHFLYVQTGAASHVDEYQNDPDGSLVPVGSLTVLDASGGEASSRSDFRQLVDPARAGDRKVGGAPRCELSVQGVATVAHNRAAG